MDKIELPVRYNGQDFSFSMQILNYTYGKKFEVIINGFVVLFEQGEEGKYRAVSNEMKMNRPTTYDIGLLKEIAKEIGYLTNRSS